jgi:type I restriction enzyme R subunit
MSLPETRRSLPPAPNHPWEKRLFRKGTRPLVRNSVKPKPGIDNTAEIIAEVVNLAKNMREAQSRGDKLKMSDEEIAFYDALAVNDGAVKVLSDETLRQIALELVDAVRKNVSIDWTVKESVRAKMRAIVKRILRAHGYPPDKQEQATLTVLAQAELLCKDWVS